MAAGIMKGWLKMEYLYKYTELSSLIFILKNREIKFNLLSTMDDQEEMMISDLAEFAKYCFVSSWTDCEDEKLSLWNMYTRDMTGIRIKLHKMPFEIYKYSIYDPKRNLTIIGDGEGTIYPREWVEGENTFAFIPLIKDKFMLNVEYTDDEKLINPDIVRLNESVSETAILVDMLGRYKRKEWYFQDEVRYRIIYLPVSLQNLDENSIMKSMQELPDLPFKERFLKIKDEYFNEIEIMTGPKMSCGDKEILNLIVKEYCPSAKIVPSKFTGKIK